MESDAVEESTPALAGDSEDCAGQDMTPRVALPSAQLIAELRALHEPELTAEEYNRLAAIPLSAAEREATLELVAWFTRKYPTPAERLAYVRRSYRQWTATRSIR